MKIAYGYDGVDNDDELFNLAVEANHTFDETAIFGAWMVDLFPVCELRILHETRLVLLLIFIRHTSKVYS